MTILLSFSTKLIVFELHKPYHVNCVNLHSKGMGATSPVAPGNQMFGGMGTGRQNRRFFRNPMNWYMMDQVVDMPDGMMWPFLMGAFN